MADPLRLVAARLQPVGRDIFLVEVAARADAEVGNEIVTKARARWVLRMERKIGAVHCSTGGVQEQPKDGQ